MSNDEQNAAPAVEKDAGPDAEMKDAGDASSKEGSPDDDEKDKAADDKEAKPEDGEDNKMKEDGGKEDGKDEKEIKGEKTNMEEKKNEEAHKKKYKDWPMRAIKDPHENDVMYGRGGGTNHHPGNKRYRKLVEDRKIDYVNSKRLDKPLVALDIIRVWRAQSPPGRFLKLDEKNGLWNDVGDKKAREKTSQALREKAPLIRKQQEEELTGDADEGKEKEVKKAPGATDPKTTRFAEGTKTETESKNSVRKAVLARDHSLGREFLQEGESVSLEGFSWQDPFQSKTSTAGSPSRPVPPPPPGNAPPLPHAASYPPAGRNSSHGSLGMPPPHHNTSIGVPPPPPPPPDYYGRTTSDDRHRQFSSGRFESWGSPYACPSPPGAMVHQRSGPWMGTPPPPQPHGGAHQRSGSWSAAREHSLSHNPLANASVNHPASQSAFDSSRSAGGYWGSAATGSSIPPPPPPPPGPYGGPNGTAGQYRSPRAHTPPKTPSPPGQYSFDISIAKTWSGGGSGGGSAGEMKRSWSGEHQQSQPPPPPGQSWPPEGHQNSPMRSGASSVPRPQIVKRDTSHQNESYETKPMVKKANLNRDNSIISKELKEKYMPEFYANGKFDTEQEMRILSDNLEQSNLGMGGMPRPKPQPLSTGARESTLDAIAMDLMVRPVPLLEGNRTSTIDALDLDLDDDPIINSEFKRELSMEEEFADLKKGVPKPSALGAGNRLSTMEFMELVNEPIADDKPRGSRASGSSKERPIDITREASVTSEWLAKV